LRKVDSDEKENKKVLLRAQATLHQGNQMLAAARPAWQAAAVQGPPAAAVQGPPAPRALQPPYLAAAPQYVYAPAPRLAAEDAEGESLFVLLYQ
jgi:hypothetical protein